MVAMKYTHNAKLTRYLPEYNITTVLKGNIILNITCTAFIEQLLLIVSNYLCIKHLTIFLGIFYANIARSQFLRGYLVEKKLPLPVSWWPQAPCLAMLVMWINLNIIQVSGDFMSLFQDLTPEVILSQKCRMNMGSILNCYRDTDIW